MSQGHPRRYVVPCLSSVPIKLHLLPWAPMSGIPSQIIFITNIHSACFLVEDVAYQNPQSSQTKIPPIFSIHKKCDFFSLQNRLRVGRPDSNPYSDLHQVRGNWEAHLCIGTGLWVGMKTHEALPSSQLMGGVGVFTIFVKGQICAWVIPACQCGPGPKYLFWPQPALPWCSTVTHDWKGRIVPEVAMGMLVFYLAETFQLSGFSKHVPDPT